MTNHFQTENPVHQDFTQVAVGQQSRGKPGALIRFLAWVAGVGAVLLVLYYLVVFPWMGRWGATDAEVQASWPGDELVSAPALRETKAVTIRAAPEAVWPWLLQLGVDRGGMYSYLWVENLVGLHVQNADRIHPEWQDLRAGDLIRLTPPDYFISHGPGVYVVSLEPNYALVGCFGRASVLLERCTSTWQFILEPQADGTTRFILRSNREAGSGFGAALGKLFQFPIFLMERKMLLGIQERANG